MAESKNLFDLFNQMDAEDECGKSVERIKVLKAPFGWIGGKSLSLSNLLPRLPYTERYIEPFGGSGVVLLNRKPVLFEIFNDRYSGITSFYLCLQDKDKLKKLIEVLEIIPSGREMFEFAKHNWENSADEIYSAALWFAKIRMSFSSKGRQFGRVTKSLGNFARRFPNSFSLFQPIHERIQNVTLENLDWREVFRDFDTTDSVFYCDPPYICVGASDDYDFNFKRSDHIELCETIFKTKGFVALSGYANDIYDSYSWDDIFKWKVNVSSKGLVGNDSPRDWAEETLYIKYSRY